MNSLVVPSRIGVMILLVLCCMSCGEESSTQPAPNPNDNALPGVSFMGHGYDVFGEYAKSEHVKSPLFQYGSWSTVTVQGKAYTIPTDIAYTSVNTADFRSVYGLTSHEYRYQMSVNASLSASFSFFSMSVTNNYSEDYYKSSNKAFCTVQNVIKKWKLTLPYTDIAKLKGLLTAEAKSDIATLAPQTLFSKYGTHFLAELLIGARADYNTCVTKCQETSIIKNNFEICAEASFKKKSGSGSFSMVTEQQLQSFESNSSQKLKVSGGRSEYGSYIFQTGKYDKWIESINNLEDLTIADFTQNSLIPIWELCADDARKNQLRTAFDTYAKQFALPGLVNEAIDGLYFEVSNNAPVTPTPGWTLINEDLNRDAKGRFIFLCYKTDLDDKESISDITFLLNNQATPAGYMKIPQDLNAGAGGDLIYLCYKKQISSRPIRRVVILVGKDAAAPPGFYFGENFYYRRKQDLNEGAGGNFIWLAYSYDLPNSWD